MLDKTKPYTTNDRTQIGKLPDAVSGETYLISGRVIAKRTLGKVIFLNLKDATGKIQLFARFSESVENNYETIREITVGDVIEVRGPLFYTKTGEKSVILSDFKTLAKPEEIPQELFNGLRHEMQHKKRGLHIMSDGEAFSKFQKRNGVIKEIRRQLYEKGFDEIETPIVTKSATTSKAENFVTHINAIDSEGFLRKSYELKLKQLVVGGFEKIFELGKAFRNEDISRVNHPEFTLMELYQANSTYIDIKNLTLELLRGLNDKVGIAETNPANVKEVFLYDFLSEAIGKDVRILSVEKIKNLIPKEDFVDYPNNLRGFYLYDLFQSLMKKQKSENFIVYGIPREISVLGKIMSEEPSLVEEFRYFVKGDLIANGITELNNYKEQKQRLIEQAKILGKEWDVEENRNFLEILKYGSLPFSGLGVGIDRIAMIYTDVKNIRDIIYFPF